MSVDQAAVDLGRLKPLEWRLTNDYPNGQCAPMYQAETVFGVYRVNGAGRGHGGSEGSASWATPTRSEQSCLSVGNGKELCWQDYRRRVAAMFG